MQKNYYLPIHTNDYSTNQTDLIMNTPTLSLKKLLNNIANYNAESISVDQAQSMIDAFTLPLSTMETCSIVNALNSVLAEDIISPINVPAHDNSAMDGYAFRGEQLQTDQTLSLVVVGTALAGHAFKHDIAIGECVKIMTGASMPPNCDTVIPQELCEDISESHIQITANTIKAQQNRRLKGEDLAQGHIAISKGKIITPADLGLLASLGIENIQVYRKLKVAFFSTGDELQSVGEDLREGCVYDSNRYTLLGMLNSLHCEVIDMGIIQDHPSALTAAMQQSCAVADVIITSGGVSTGSADYTKQVMSELGECAFWNINMRPGRPFAFGKITHEQHSSYVFGLPGNPVAVMVSFYFLVKAALQKIMGATKTPTLFSSAISTAKIKKRQGRTEYQRGIAHVNNQGQLEVSVTGSQGSGILRSMSEANCMIVLSESQGDVAVGEVLQIVLFKGLI